MTNANDFFGSGNGSSCFYQCRHSSIVYTEGVKDMADTCKAYWLIDLIVSHQINALVRSEPFQVWELKKLRDGSFKAIATDGNRNNLTRQLIPFSDFPYERATLWLVDGCLLLPNEY